MKKKPTKTTQHTSNAVLAGIGVAALAAAAAGTYYLYGSKDAVKNRKKVKGWMLQAKGEILEQLEAVKDINKEMYHQIVNEVVDRYEKIKKLDMQEIKDLKDELIQYWEHIKQDIQNEMVIPENMPSKKNSHRKRS